jgi:tetratricopeptide (TPR) repeat protein
MSSTSQSESSTALVREGWNHLQSQRPLAAWGSWQRALRADPARSPARKALSTLESAADLPLAARTSYRFREPVDPSRRSVWDDRMRGWNPEDLAAASDLFGRLAVEGAGDPAAWYNRALCLAWIGENRESMACLDRVVGLEAADAFDRAVDAWTLAEVLRQGGGAEIMADDLRYVCSIAWQPGQTAWLLDEFPEIVRVPTPRAPGDAPDESSEIEVFEWLDRPASSLDQGPLYASELPVVLASVFISRHSLRLSSLRVEALERVEEMLFLRLQAGSGPVRREAVPLPFPFLDADLWTFRIPPGVDPHLAEQLQRESVELYFENQWIHRLRHGLDGRAPIVAARQARGGDAIARAKLTAVVRLREQLGSRKSASALYQGYPFDRLRRRLGLALRYDMSIDLADLSCAAPEELDRLDPATLDDARLLEVVTSAAGLRDDARTARLAALLVGRRPAAMRAPALTSVISPLVRQAMTRDNHDGALSWIDQARSMGDAQSAATLDVWRAEILARAGRPQEALSIYRSLIKPNASGAAVALDGAETLLDNGHLDQAESLLIEARNLAVRVGRHWIERRAQQLLDGLS